MLNQEFFIETKNFMMAKLNLFLVPKSAKIFAHNHLYKVTLYLLQLFGIHYSQLMIIFGRMCVSIVQIANRL